MDDIIKEISSAKNPEGMNEQVVDQNDAGEKPANDDVSDIHSVDNLVGEINVDESEKGDSGEAKSEKGDSVEGDSGVEDPKNELMGLEGDDKSKKIEELLAADELSDEEAEFLNANGHEVSFEDDDEGDQSGEDGKSDKEKEEADKKKEEEDAAKKEEEDAAAANARPEYAEFIEGIFPDENFETRADFEKAALKHFKNEQAANEKLVEVLQDNSELQGLIKDMTSGVPFLEAVHKNIDLDALTVKPGDEDYEKTVRAKLERERQVENRKALQKEREENFKKSADTAVSFAKEYKLGKSVADNLYQEIDRAFENYNKGLVDRKFYEVMYKGLHYDDLLKKKEDEIRNAERRGEVKGKNSAIIVKKKKAKGDGLPKPRSSKNSISSQSREKFNDPLEELVSIIKR